MDEIKIDLQNKFLMDKYYAELEIIRLSNLTDMNQKLRVELLTEQIDILEQSKRRLEILDLIYPAVNQNSEERSEK